MMLFSNLKDIAIAVAIAAPALAQDGYQYASKVNVA